jgi:hypothetical protein
MSEKQLSRVAGVPRFPLATWKRIADTLIKGEDVTRRQQQGGKKSKVQIAREMAASDSAFRSAAIKLAKAVQAEAALSTAASQGWSVNTDAVSANQPQGLVDPIVQCLEKEQNPSEHFTAAELAEPADTEESRELAEIAACATPKPVTHGCNYCGKPATRELTVCGRQARFCSVHDGTPKTPFIPPASTGSPAEYINSDYGKRPVIDMSGLSPEARARLEARQRELEAIRAASVGLVGPGIVHGQPTFGPAIGWPKSDDV